MEVLRVNSFSIVTIFGGFFESAVSPSLILSVLNRPIAKWALHPSGSSFPAVSVSYTLFIYNTTYLLILSTLTNINTSYEYGGALYSVPPKSTFGTYRQIYIINNNLG